jgi:anaerobic selenocysteine-containing dehydrogenase
MLEEGLYDKEFLKQWTNGGFLVSKEAGQPLTQAMLSPNGRSDTYVVWDCGKRAPAFYNPQSLNLDPSDAQPAFLGRYGIRLCNGRQIETQPVFELFQDRIKNFPPEKTTWLTGVPPDLVRQAVRLFCATKPACYYSYNGLEQYVNAMQTNRAVCLFYSLTGNLDVPGGNVWFPKAPVNNVEYREALPWALTKIAPPLLTKIDPPRPVQ